MPDDQFASATMPEDFEVVFNFWCFTDKTGFIRVVAARAYAMAGTEEEKLALLTRLSATDFMTAKFREVPENFSHVTEKKTFTGVVHRDQVNEHIYALFNPLINDLKAELPNVPRRKGERQEAVRLGPPENVLQVLTTVLKGSDGSLTAQVAS